MKLLVDHRAGRRLAEWLRAKGHDIFDAGGESALRVGSTKRDLMPPELARPFRRNAAARVRAVRLSDGLRPLAREHSGPDQIHHECKAEARLDAVAFTEPSEGAVVGDAGPSLLATRQETETIAEQAGIRRRTAAGMRSRSRWRTSRSVAADRCAIAPARSGGAPCRSHLPTA